MTKNFGTFIRQNIKNSKSIVEMLRLSNILKLAIKVSKKNNCNWSDLKIIDNTMEYVSNNFKDEYTTEESLLKLEEQKFDDGLFIECNLGNKLFWIINPK